MRSFLLSLSGKYQAIFVITATIIASFCIAIFSSLFFDMHQLATNTDLTSSIYQVMGTVYAILLTFTLWGVWQKFTDAGTSVQNEVYALLDLVHIVEASSAWKNNNIRHAALTYSKLVVEQEWPTLKNLTNNDINIHEKNRSPSMQIIQTVQSIIPTNGRDTILFEQALTLLNNWLDARRSRILIARGNSAKALWPLLFTGASVLFAFHGLFVAKTLGIWATLLFGTSLVIGVTFYLIFTLDCPFDGSLTIDSEPFALAISILEKEAFPA
jgi:hypothetical protein